MDFVYFVIRGLLKYALDDKGEAQTIGKNFQRFVPNLKFAFQAFAKAHGTNYVWDVSAGSLLKELEALRNRITHPKKLNEMSVSDSEMKNTQKLWNWFSAQLLTLMRGGLTTALTIRTPPPPVTRLNATKKYVVILPTGDVYQFNTFREAKAFEKPHRINKHSSGFNPCILKVKDLKKLL